MRSAAARGGHVNPAHLPANLGQAAESVNGLIDTLRAMRIEANPMTDEHDKGDIDVAIDMQKFNCDCDFGLG